MKWHFSDKHSVNYPFLFFITIIVLATFSIEMINNRFLLTDFKVYYTAAQKYFSGQQVYNLSLDSGSGYYKYSPVILFFFFPLSLLGYKTASIIYFFILGLAFWYTYHTIIQLYKKFYFPENLRHEGWLISVSFIMILVYFVREMHLGNLNILLLLLSSKALISFIDHKHFRGGLFLGLVILTKPFYFPLLLILVFRKQWKSIFFLAVVIITGGLIPIIYSGYSQGIFHYSGWINTLLAHDHSFPGTGTVFYILSQQFTSGVTGFAEYLIMLIICCLVILFVLCNLKAEKKTSGTAMSERNFIFEWFLLIAVFPLMFRNDWVQFLLSAPLLTFIVFFIATTKKYWLIPVILIPLFFFSAISDDLLGKDTTDWFLKSGLTGLSNLLLISCSVIMFLKMKRLPQNLSSEL